jgi:hypothetical protein
VVHKKHGVVSGKSAMLHEILQHAKAVQEADDKVYSIIDKPEGTGKQGRFTAPVLS